MFLQQRISILEWFLNDHVTLKTGVIINPFSGARNWATNVTFNQKPQTGASKGNMAYLLRDLSQIIRIHNANPWISLVWMCESRCISGRMSWGQLLSVNKLRPTNIAWTPYTTTSRSAVTPCALYIWQNYTFISLSFRWKMRRFKRLKEDLEQHEEKMRRQAEELKRETQEKVASLLICFTTTLKCWRLIIKELCPPIFKFLFTLKNQCISCHLI